MHVPPLTAFQQLLQRTERLQSEAVPQSLRMLRRSAICDLQRLPAARPTTLQQFDNHPSRDHHAGTDRA